MFEQLDLFDWEPRGLDLEEHVGLVRRIYRGRFRARVVANGLDPDDVFQELLLSIHNRNNGRNPYDPTRSAPSSWIYQVCRSVTQNQIDKHRRRSWELLGYADDAALGAAEEVP